MESKVLAEVILSALKERKAFDIVKINVEEKTTVADPFPTAIFEGSIKTAAPAQASSQLGNYTSQFFGGDVKQRGAGPDTVKNLVRYILLKRGAEHRLADKLACYPAQLLRTIKGRHLIPSVQEGPAVAP